MSCLRVHLTSNAICAPGKLFSRSRWNPHRLFDPIFNHLAHLLPTPDSPVLAALDDTLCRNSGRKIPGASMGRDPQSLPFHVNLRRGLRFMQLSVLVSPRNQSGTAHRQLIVAVDGSYANGAFLKQPSPASNWRIDPPLYGFSNSSSENFSNTRSAVLPS